MCLEGYELLGEEWYIAADEGSVVLLNGQDGTPYMSLEQCEDACTDTDGCNSISHCPRDIDRCYLRGGIFTGSEPTIYKYYCSSYYKITAEGISPPFRRV